MDSQGQSVAEPSPAALIQFGQDMQAFKQYYVSIFTLLVYDYLMTLPDEIHYGWTGRSTPVYFLFLLNRYVPLASAVIILFSYFLPQWTFEICDRYVVFEWIVTYEIVLVAEILLFLRVYALSLKSKAVLAPLFALMLGQSGIFLYVVSQPGNNGLPTPDYTLDIFHACILAPRLANYDLSFLGMSLAFDSIAVGLTLYFTAVKAGFSSRLTDTMKRDGIIYFAVIFSGNLIWVLLVLFARPSLKFMHAIPSLLMTSIMINHLILSLKKSQFHQTGDWNFSIFSDIPMSHSNSLLPSSTGEMELRNIRFGNSIQTM